MCGIFGYLGKSDAAPILIKGLKKQEYRGYDSAGIALNCDDNSLYVVKKAGRVSQLERAVDFSVKSCCGIAHTRWATHGKPSDENSHPHTSGDIAVVHNGIIENYQYLKDKLKNKGYKFNSDTDTEVIAKLIDSKYSSGTELIDAVLYAVNKLEGSFAIAVIARGVNEIICARKNSPLIVGFAKSGYYIASDIPALLEYTKKVHILKSGEVLQIKEDRAELTDFYGNKLKTEIKNIEAESSDSELSGFESYMLKEIYEIPASVNRTVTSNKDITDFLKNKKFNHIYIIGCGTAYNAGRAAESYIENWSKIKVTSSLASEFRYDTRLCDKNSLAVFITQSGETADTLEALKAAKECGAYCLAITNVENSSITHIADKSLFTKAGPEIAVASTKAYCCQVALLTLFAAGFAKAGGNNELFDEVCSELLLETNRISEYLEKQNVSILAEKYKDTKSVFFIGRGRDYPLAEEGSLKFKEITYISSEGYAAGELKHGTIALMDKNALVVAIVTKSDMVDKIVNAVCEVRARGAKVVVLSTLEVEARFKDISDDVIIVNGGKFPTIAAVVPLQLFAYYTAKIKGLDADKPRNLAKSVTVE